MNENDEILIGLLGRCDAIFAAPRVWARNVGPNLYAARELYRELGIPLYVGDQRSSEAKAARRMLDELAADGQIVIAKRPGSKAIYAKLTDAADFATRQLCGLPNEWCSWSFVRDLFDHADGTTAWISEFVMCPLPRGEIAADDRIFQELCALPAIVRGRCEAHSDGHGEAYYRLTPEGLAFAPTAPEPAKEPARKNCEADAYWAAVKAELARIESTPPANPKQIGLIPFSCSGAPR